MKYKPRDRYERVSDTWESQRVVLENSWEVKQHDPISQNSAGKYFPNTLRKSYYKTIESVALDLLPAIKPNAQQQVQNREALSENIGKNIETLQTERKLSEIAKEAMDKCKLRAIVKSHDSSELN